MKPGTHEPWAPDESVFSFCVFYGELDDEATVVRHAPNQFIDFHRFALSIGKNHLIYTGILSIDYARKG